MPVNKSVLIFALLLIGFFCISGLGLFAPHLRDSFVASVLGLDSGADFDRTKDIQKNRYLEEIDKLEPLSERMRKPRKIAPSVQFPDLGTPEQEPEKEPAKETKRPADRPGPGFGRSGTSFVKSEKPIPNLRREFQGDDIERFINERYPDFMPKAITAWSANIEADKINFQATVDTSELKKYYKNQLPAKALALLGDKLNLTAKISLVGRNGKCVMDVTDLNLGGLNIREEMRKALLKKIFTAQGKEMRDPTHHVFDLPPAIDTIAIRGDMLIINEESPIKIK
ncbi:hypothetical protein ACFLU6_00325 [Acidobacteriota bacterium]